MPWTAAHIKTVAPYYNVECYVSYWPWWCSDGSLTSPLLSRLIPSSCSSITRGQLREEAALTIDASKRGGGGPGTTAATGSTAEDEDAAPSWPPPLLPPFARGGGLLREEEEEEDWASCKRADRRREGSDLPLVELAGRSGSMLPLVALVE